MDKPFKKRSWAMFNDEQDSKEKKIKKLDFPVRSVVQNQQDVSGNNARENAISTPNIWTEKETVNQEINTNKSKRSSIKRPMNAFMLWSKEKRPFFSIADPTANMTKISALLGIEWNRLSEDQKKPYFDEAHRLQAQHRQMYPEWVFQPRKKRGPADPPVYTFQTSLPSTVTFRSLPVEETKILEQSRPTISGNVNQNVPVPSPAPFYPPASTIAMSWFLSVPHFTTCPHCYIRGPQFHPSEIIPRNPIFLTLEEFPYLL